MLAMGSIYPRGNKLWMRYKDHAGRWRDASTGKPLTERRAAGVELRKVESAVKAQIARLLRRVAPRLQVLGHSEIPETHTIRIGPILRGAT